MGWKLPALYAVLVVVALALAGVLAGQLIGGFYGAAVGVIPGALSGVAAGFIPALRDAGERRRAELARRDEDSARAQEAWEAAGEPADEPAGRGPAALLRPDREIVEFTGRKDELDALRAWCASDRRRSVRVLVGAGGAGKTRLALKVAGEWAAAGREWRLVAAGRETDVLAAARKVRSGPVLLVVDYAETRTGLEALLDEVLADRGVVRVLLAARSLGEWWERLVEKSAPAVGRLLNEADPVRLDAPVVQDTPDAGLAAAAVPYFARALGVEPPGQVEFRLPAGPVPILVAHAAALVAVLRLTADPAAAARVAITDDVLDELLWHEARYWRRCAAAGGLRDNGSLIKPVVAAAALLGAGNIADAAEIVGRVPDHVGASLAERRQWARWLFGLYPAGADGRLGPLQPDLLAEKHVTDQLAADPELSRACLRKLSPQQAEHALTILARAWAHQDQAGPVIAAALHADLAHLAAAAAAVALQTRSDLGGLLAAALRDAPIRPEELAQIAEDLPYPSVALGEAGLAAAQRVRKLLPPEADPGTLARWAERVAGILFELGRPADALAAGLEALAIRRERAAADPDGCLPDLADLLSGLGALLSDLDHRQADAVHAGEEAVTIYRELAAADRGRYLPGLATSLDNLGAMFYPLGRPADALAAAQEAVTIRRELAAASTDTGPAGLAQSLINLGPSLSVLGRPADALDATGEAVTIFRELAAATPDRYLPELTLSLNNLSIWLSELGRTANALLVTEEALEIRREMAAANPGRYRPLVAQSLDNLGARLAELGRPGDALSATQEAVTIYREMTAAAHGRWRTRTGLATALDNLGVRLAALGRHGEALSATQEAVTAYRDLAAATPERWRPNLATALTNLGTQFAALNRPADALRVTEEAITIYQELPAASLGRHRTDLAISLNSLSMRLMELGRPADALIAAHEAVAIRQELAAQIPDRHRHDLAASLNNLGAVLSALGRQADAAAAHTEAQAIHGQSRYLADSDPRPVSETRDT